MALALTLVAAGCRKKTDDSIANEDRKPAQKQGSTSPSAGPKWNDPLVAGAARKDAQTEAYRALGSIETGSKMAFQIDTDSSGEGIGPFVHTFCPNGAIAVPPTPPTAPYPSKPEDWEVDPWKCLKFSMGKPQLCSYQYRSNGKSGVASAYSAIATCDPGGDGQLMRITLKGKGSDSGEAIRDALIVEDPVK